MTTAETTETNGTVKVKRSPEAEATMKKVHEANAEELRHGIATASREQIETKLVDESPFNKRRTWGDLEELAKTYREVGILQDLVGRPHPKKEGRIELVFGARRLRGAKLAKLETVPMRIVDLDDAQVAELIAIENLQRQDIHPLEEAEVFEQLRAKQHLTVDELAAKLGKTRAYVYARLKYLDLCEPARKAFAAGELTSSVALYVARIPHEQLQVQCLKDLRSYGGRHEKGEPIAARVAFSLIDRQYMLRLADAPFDPKDAKLLPAAGACGDCPKRTGNQKDLFADVSGADVCTDPLCFAEKRDAGVKAKRIALEAKGVQVVPGKKGYGDSFHTPDGFVDLDVQIYQGIPHGSKLYGKTLTTIAKAAKGVELPRMAYFDDKGHAHRIVASGKVPSILKAAGVKVEKSATRKPKTKEEKLKEAASEEVTTRVHAAIVAAVEKKGANDALWRVMVAGLEAKHVLDKLKGPKLVAHAAKVILTEDYDDSAMGPLAKSYGVDVRAIERDVVAGIAAAALAKVGEKGAKGKTTSPAAKKGRHK